MTIIYKLNLENLIKAQVPGNTCEEPDEGKMLYQLNEMPRPYKKFSTKFTVSDLVVGEQK